MQSLKEFSIYTLKYIGKRDAYSILANAEALGLEESIMTENAGYVIAENLKKGKKGDNILILCGVGGKGAIGMSLARHLLNYVNVKVFTVGDISEMHRKAALLNYKLLSSVMEIDAIDDSNINQLKKYIAKSDTIIDALIGIGIRGRLNGLLRDVITIVNDSKKDVISIDIPSGVDPDTGTMNVIHIKPTSTIALHKIKKGIVKNTSMQSINTIDIGVPISAEILSGPGDVALATERIPIDSNKYTHGSVLVVGGSKDYHGAPILAARAATVAMAALRSGIGYVTIAVPKQIEMLARQQSPGIIVKGFTESMDLEDVTDIIRTTKHTAMVLGPGIADLKYSYKKLTAIIKYERELGNRMVIDAGAMHALLRYQNLISNDMVLTPHYGEYKAISGKDLSKETLHNKVMSALDFAKRYNCVLVLKGHETIITNGDLLKINRANTPALATMGTGDVLSGMIGSYAAVHSNSFESAVAAVYLHSRIGDALYTEKGNHIVAQDVIDYMPTEFKKYDKVNGAYI
ncbi:MAG: NAD(P)H-hydrate dehydratase [Candidatus Micrarchaeaceae archaeon]